MCEIDPTELRDQHMKFYGEASLRKAVAKYQVKYKISSESAALRHLVMSGLSAESECESAKRA